MKTFSEFVAKGTITESAVPNTLNLIKQLVGHAEKAYLSGNKAAGDEFLQAIFNSGDSIAMSKHVENAKRALGK